MKVKLVSMTKPEVEGMETAEDIIIYCARVSNPKNQMNKDSAGLVRFLIKNRHWSPFELASMCVEIKTSRGIAQQILRHRSFSYQEFSQRYAIVENMEPVQLRLQADKNRQSSTSELPKVSRAWDIVSDSIHQSKEAYKRLIEMGVAKECARFVLPITTETTMYMTGTVRSWITYFMVRCNPHAQLEHRQVAEAIQKIFNEQFPHIAKAIDAIND